MKKISRLSCLKRYFRFQFTVTNKKFTGILYFKRHNVTRMRLLKNVQGVLSIVEWIKDVDIY